MAMKNKDNGGSSYGNEDNSGNSDGGGDIQQSTKSFDGILAMVASATATKGQQ
jgi:hypothetical protein